MEELEKGAIANPDEGCMVVIANPYFSIVPYEGRMVVANPDFSNSKSNLHFILLNADKYSEEIEIFGVFIPVISLCNSRFCLKRTKLKIA